jgi:type IV secretion system protein VirB1
VLAGLLATCAPGVDVRTEASVVAIESSAWPYALNDNDTGRAYYPETLDQAKALLRRISGHQVAVGIAQVDSVNFGTYGVDAVQLLEPCMNLRVGSAILAAYYRQAYRRTSGTTEEEHRQAALREAFSAYNSGSPTKAKKYAALVVAATSSRLVRETTAIADAARGRRAAAEGPAGRGATPTSSDALRVAYGPASASSVFVGTVAKISGSAFVGGSE